MEKRYLMVGLVALLLCSSCNEELLDAAFYTDHQIVLSAAIRNPAKKTKAPINSDFSTPFSTGIYAVLGNWQAGASGNYINNDSAVVSGLPGHLISFSKKYDYPANGSVLTFYAYAPYTATVSTLPSIGISPTVSIPMTGHEDIMWAKATGSLPVGSNTPSNPALTYNHKLTQLNFIFKSGSGYPDGTDKVVSFKLQSQATAARMTVETGSCTFSGGSDMQLLTGTQLTEGIPITAVGTNAGSLMTEPNTKFNILVTVKQQLSGVNYTYNTVQFTLNAVVGKAHTVNVVFNKTGVNVSCSTSDWQDGDDLTINQ